VPYATPPRILIVEDDHAHVELALRGFAHVESLDRALTVYDGPEAIAALSKREGRNGSSELPCLVLLNLELPTLHGLEVLRRIRVDERTRRLPVVVFTESREHSDIAACYDLGANSYIVKPEDPQEYVDLLRTLVDYWLNRNVFITN
jgi:two-component system response regulator